MLHDTMDANILQSQLYALGRRSEQLRKRGICTHGWSKGEPGNPDGRTVCLHCGAEFDTFADLLAARAEALA